MTKNTKSKFVNEILKDLKKTSMYLSEAYIFNEEGPEGMEDEGMPMYGDEEMGGAPPMEQGTPQQSAEGNGDSEEEKAMHAQEVIQHEPIISKIRETAIEGLRKYSDNPTSKIYEFFKKVFLESDKVLTDTGGNK